MPNDQKWLIERDETGEVFTGWSGRWADPLWHLQREKAKHFDEKTAVDVARGLRLRHSIFCTARRA